MTKFTIDEKHLKLLHHANVSWENCEFGAPAIDCKRPYGNGDVVGDIVKILFGELPEDTQEALSDYARQLHKETETALQICLYTQKFEVGTYENKQYTNQWVKL